MIQVKKSYQENISSEENKYYERLIQHAVAFGTIEDKHQILLQSSDVANIFMLMILYLQDRSVVEKEEDVNVGFSNGQAVIHNQSVKQKVRTKIPLTEQEYSNIGKIFILMPDELRESVLFSLGLEIVVGMSLDEIPEIEQTLKEIGKKEPVKTRLLPQRQKSQQ